MDYWEMLRVSATVLLAEYSVVATHVRHQDQRWQKNLFLLNDPGMYGPARPTWKRRWAAKTRNLNFDLFHLHSAMRWPLTLSFLFWPFTLSWIEMGLTAGITAPLSWLVWALTKRA